MNELMVQMEQDSTNEQQTSKLTSGSDDTKKELSDLIQTMLNYQKHIAEIEQSLKDEKAKLRKVSEDLIPEKMAELHMSQITMDDGSSVKVVDDVAVGIRREDLDTAMKYLDDNGFGAIIKNEVVVRFGRGEAEKANYFVERIKAEEVSEDYTQKESVNTMTLKATIKEQLSKGNSPFANDEARKLFGIYEYKKTTVKEGVGEVAL